MSHSNHHGHGEHAHHVTSMFTLVGVLAVLCALTVLTFLAYFKGDRLKSGVTDSTFRQVIQYAKSLGYTEDDTIRKMKIREFCASKGHSYNSDISESNNAVET